MGKITKLKMEGKITIGVSIRGRSTIAPLKKVETRRGN
jgi:hypothetical protein